MLQLRFTFSTSVDLIFSAKFCIGKMGVHYELLMISSMGVKAQVLLAFSNEYNCYLMPYFKWNTGNLNGLHSFCMANPESLFPWLRHIFMGFLFYFEIFFCCVFLLGGGGICLCLFLLVLLLLFLLFWGFLWKFNGFFCMLMIPEKIFWICFLLHSFSICLLLCICCL